MLICLQRLDAEGVNQGGLYLNIGYIAAVYFNRHVKNLPEGVRGRCVVVMSSGVEYTVADTVSEVLEKINGGRSI